MAKGIWLYPYRGTGRKGIRVRSQDAGVRLLDGRYSLDTVYLGTTPTDGTSQDAIYFRKKLFVQLKWDRETESIYRVASRPEEDRYVGPSGGCRHIVEL